MTNAMNSADIAAAGGAIASSVTAALKGRLVSTLPDALVVKIQRILAAAAQVRPAGVLGSDPMTMGVANANSTIRTDRNCTSFNQSTGVSNATVQVNDPAIEWISGKWAIGGGSGWRSNTILQANGTSRSGAQGPGLGTCYDGQAMDIAVVGGAGDSTSAIRCRVTDLKTRQQSWTAASDYLVTNGLVAYAKFDFGSAADRLLEFFFGKNTYVRGLNFEVGRMIWRPVRTGLKGAYFRDSWAASIVSGGASSSVRAGCGYACLEALGVENPIVLGYPGSGLTRAGVPTYGARIAPSGIAANGDLSQAQCGKLDAILLLISLNDNGDTDAAVTAALIAVLPVLRAEQPDAIIIITGPQNVQSSPAVQARYDAAAAAVVSAGDPAVIYVDTSPAGTPITTGTGFSGTIPVTASVSGTTLTVTGNSTTTKLFIGMPVSHANLPAGTVISAGPGGSFTGVFTLSNSASAPASGTFTIGGANNTGNGQNVIGNDGTHPVDDAAHGYYGRREAAAILQTLAAKLAA